MSHDRRDFLKQFSGLTAAVVGAPVLMDATASAQSKPDAGTPPGLSLPACGQFALELGVAENSSFAGWLDSVTGGAAVGQVVIVREGGDNVPTKHLGRTQYEEITLTCGVTMSSQFYNWIKGTFSGSPVAMDGAIIAAGTDQREIGRLSFFGALISEVTLPALDASSKDPARLTVKITPTRTLLKFGAGQNPFPPQPPGPPWLTSNFSLQIAGLEDDCKNALRIGELTLKQDITQVTPGNGGGTQLVPNGLEFPDLLVTLPQPHSSEFYNWWADFVISGNNDASKEKSGSLQYLSPDLSVAFFTLNLYRLGIYKFSFAEIAPNSSTTCRVQAAMYCDSMTFDFS